MVNATLILDATALSRPVVIFSSFNAVGMSFLYSFASRLLPFLFSVLVDRGVDGVTFSHHEIAPLGPRSPGRATNMPCGFQMLLPKRRRVHGLPL
jgi:hypothetical protein